MSKSTNAMKTIALYARMNRDLKRLWKSCACWRAGDIGIEFTPEERVLLNEASRSLDKATDCITQIYSKRIGEQVTSEIRLGLRTLGRARR